MTRFVNKIAALATLAAIAFSGAAVTATSASAACVKNVAYNDVLNMRDRPGTGGAIIGIIGHNKCGVSVLRRDGRWGYVRYRGNRGWVNLKFISTGGSSHRCVTNVANNDVLNIRRRPTNGSAIRGIIPPHACGVRVLNRSGNWYNIRFRGTRGWVNGRYLTR